jgi:hypothetical protein
MPLHRLRVLGCQQVRWLVLTLLLWPLMKQQNGLGLLLMLLLLPLVLWLFQRHTLLALLVLLLRLQFLHHILSLPPRLVFPVQSLFF